MMMRVSDAHRWIEDRLALWVSASPSSSWEIHSRNFELTCSICWPTLSHCFTVHLVSCAVYCSSLLLCAHCIYRLSNPSHRHTSSPFVTSHSHTLVRSKLIFYLIFPCHKSKCEGSMLAGNTGRHLGLYALTANVSSNNTSHHIRHTLSRNTIIDSLRQ